MASYCTIIGQVIVTSTSFLYNTSPPLPPLRLVEQGQNRRFDLSADITPSAVNQATFDEHLLAIADDGSEVGFYDCSVTTPDDKTVVVKVQSQYAIGETKYTIELTSELGINLGIFSESYKQTQTANNKSVVRRLRAQRDLKDLRVETEVCADGVLTKFERIYDLRDVELFLANGAVLVMQRVYAITGAQSRVTLNTLDIDGTLCCLACEFLGGKDANCDSTSMSEVAVEQTLCSPTGHSITTQKYFTTYGQLVSVVQIGSPVVFKLAQPPLPIIKDQYLPIPHVGEDDFFWRDNISYCTLDFDWSNENACSLAARISLEQNHSPFNNWLITETRRCFFFLQEELISQYHLYLYDHPEFTDLLKDFLQALLMEKPEDTYNFAADYFTSFSKRREETTCLKQA
ncbi:unnamed protein product [Mesocestoides corti]|uniref:RIIa domain-containing protein n=1 Tax=Mesocestoides corti TaxID=53468 RepID=A0A0R3UMQ0_MESCO|nr:unnamed protein product [Mesocestoides corti]